MDEGEEGDLQQGITVKFTPGFPSMLCARLVGQEPLSLSCSLSAKLILEKLNF